MSILRPGLNRAVKNWLPPRWVYSGPITHSWLSCLCYWQGQSGWISHVHVHFWKTTSTMLTILMVLGVGIGGWLRYSSSSLPKGPTTIKIKQMLSGVHHFSSANVSVYKWDGKAGNIQGPWKQLPGGLSALVWRLGCIYLAPDPATPSVLPGPVPSALCVIVLEMQSSSPPQPYWSRICIYTISSGGSHGCVSWRSTSPNNQASVCY